MKHEVHTFDGMEHGDIYNRCEEKKLEWHDRVVATKEANYKFMDWKLYNAKHVNFAEGDQWSHLSDAVQKGTITPLEAHDALELGYVPENLKVRESRYSHLI
jgi:hypothetical protein